MHHLERRKNVYYFRIWVPKDLQGYFGRREIRKSLRVRSAAEARHLVTIASGRFERIALLAQHFPP